MLKIVVLLRLYCSRQSNIDRIVLSPDRKTLITIDVDGFALFINFPKRVVIAHFNFKNPVTAFAFSPDSKFFVVATKGAKVKVFEVPSVDHKVYSPLILYKKYANLHSQEITGVTWTTDSRFFLTWSEDLTLKLMSLHKLPGYLPFTFGGNKKKIVNAFFNEDNTRIFTVSQNGTVLLWKWTDEKGEGVQKVLEFQQFKMQKRLKTGPKENEYIPVEEDISLYSDFEKKITQGRFLLEKKTKFQLQNQAKVTSCDYNSNIQATGNKILVIGQSNGVFALFNMDTLESLHSFQISENKINSISINTSGEWIALASRELGQLFVWEWKSETYVMKQQGHFFDLNTIAYSPDGALIATGGDDGKVKLWTTKNCLCFVTFSDHTAQVTDLKFIPKKGNAVLSSILQALKLTQFTCLSIDSTGDLVCAGAMDPFEVYIWSLRTGQLIDTLSGHTGPISCVQFAQQGSLLATGSWDHTVRVWDIFEKKGIIDTLSHSSEVIAVDFHANNKDMVSTTLSGQMYMWQADEGHLIGTIDCKNDLAGGRMRDDRTTAKNSTKNKHFNSIAISPNGDFIIGGGNSKNICLYDMRFKLMIKRFAVTQNRSLDGVLQILNSKHVSGEAGVADHELDIDSDLEEDAWQFRNQADSNLPGAKKPNNAQSIKRNTKLAVRIKKVLFSPDGTQFSCATTEGLVIYSLRNDYQVFNPVDIDENVTLDNIIQCVKKEEYLPALLMALKINEIEVIDKIYKCIPLENVPLISAHFPSNYLFKFLDFLAHELEKGKDLEWTMIWIKNLLKYQEQALKKYKELGQGGKGRSLMLKIYSGLQFYDNSVKKIANENMHMMKFMIRTAEFRKEESTTEQEQELE
eukprot:403368319